MSHHPDPRPGRSDEAWDRLRAADPAADLTPDATALGAAVRSRLGAAVRVPVPDAVGGDMLAAARARRRPSRWLAVAAVAAGTLAVGSVGYALGDRPDGDLTASSSTAAITLPGAGTSGPGVSGGIAESASGARAAEGSVGADLALYGGRTVFSARGLSTAGGAAEAWGLDPGQVFSAETAARAAAALGVAGEPVLQDGVWVVGAQDGNGPNLQLQPDGVASVSFYDPTRDPFGCAVPVLEEDVPDGAAEPGSTGVAPDAPTCDPADLGTALQGDAAVARAREAIAATGADPDAFEYEVMDAGTPQAVYVTAHGVLGGQRTGLLWSVTLVGDAVQSLYGYLAPLVPLGSYEVVSPDAAVARLSDPRFGASGGFMMAADGGAVVREQVVEPDGPVAGGQTAPPAPLTAGAPFAWPVTEVVLTGARLGLAQHTQPDGATALLPAYELTDDAGMTWSVVAVAESALDFSAPARP